MSNSSHGTELKNPGKLPAVPQLNLLFIVLFALGAGAFAMALKTDLTRAWGSFALNYFFFMCFAVGGLFFAAIQHATNAMWSAPVRRIAEAYTSFLPFVLILFVILAVFGLHHLYEWSHPDVIAADAALRGKVGYLNGKFFIIRNVIAILLWIFFAKAIVGNSLKQDATGDFRYTKKNRVLAPLFLIVFALSFTMMSFDVLMSLDPHWFSTIYGVYCFAGLFYSVLALTCIIAILLRRANLLVSIISEDHLHDIGKFMFAFTVFWAYISFAQFMLIWYANLPEENYIRRFHGGWFNISVFLLVGKFLVPFFALIARGSKRNECRLLIVASFMLVAQWIDLLWLIQPELGFSKLAPHVGWIEIGTTLGFTGLFGVVVTRFLSKNNLVAIGDPRLKESVEHHHQ